MTEITDVGYYYSRQAGHEDFNVAVAAVKAALQAEGFGVLTEIDVQATMKAKIGLDFRPYLILGACNPDFAHRALNAAEWIGTLMPCNVIVQQHDDGTIHVGAMNPTLMGVAVDDEDLMCVGEEVAEKLTRVLAAV